MTRDDGIGNGDLPEDPESTGAAGSPDSAGDEIAWDAGNLGAPVDPSGPVEDDPTGLGLTTVDYGARVGDTVHAHLQWT